MSIEKAYDHWSGTYDLDRNLTRDLDQKVTREALAGSRFKSILEIGCGTGKNTALLAQVGEKVFALDFSQRMIARARSKIPFPHVTFAVADLTDSWPCDAQSADLVVCNLVLEHIRDISFIFAQVFRALMPGGCFFLCELHPYRQYQGTQAHFQDDKQITTQIPAFVHHLSEFIQAGGQNGLTLESFNEWWHENDENKPPRLISFMFKK